MKSKIAIIALLTLMGCAPAMSQQEIKAVLQTCIDAGLVVRTEQYQLFHPSVVTAVKCEKASN